MWISFITHLEDLRRKSNILSVIIAWERFTYVSLLQLLWNVLSIFSITCNWSHDVYTTHREFIEAIIINKMHFPLLDAIWESVFQYIYVTNKSNVVIQYVAVMVRMLVNCVWCWSLCGPLLSVFRYHTLFWAQTPFIKATLYTTLKGIRPHGCSEVTHIFLAIPISHIWD